MMADDKDAHGAAGDAEQKMVGKPLEIGTAKVVLANGKRCGLSGRARDKMPKLGVEVVSKLLTGGSLVIVHDRVHIGMDFRMQNDSHQQRRSRTRWSS